MNPLRLLNLLRAYRVRHAFTDQEPLGGPDFAYWYLRVIGAIVLLIIVSAIAFAILERTGLIYKLLR